MGLADRDYARNSPSSHASPALSRRRSRGFGLLTVNTWLIVINVAIFVLGHVLVPLMQQAALKSGKPSVAELLMARVSSGIVYFDNPTEAQKSRAKVERGINLPMPTMQGYYYHPIYDPQEMQRDAFGHPVVDINGKPVAKIIGGERFTTKPIFDAWGHFSTGKAFLELQVWRFLTFQFLHIDITHLLFNMLGLWFAGPRVEEFLGRRRYLAFYLTSGIFGAIGYLLLNFIGWIVGSYVSPSAMESIPAVLFNDIYLPLVGASAGVFGVLMAAAYIAPTEIVDVFFVIPMKMRTAVYIFLALAMLNLLRGGHNAGGDAAHVGGAFAGAYFIRRMYLLRDFFEFVGMPREKPRHDDPNTSEIDRILDKINATGLQSLTEQEQQTLAANRGSQMDAGA